MARRGGEPTIAEWVCAGLAVAPLYFGAEPLVVCDYGGCGDAADLP
jgi:hypothetical protein